jgi:uncharacterized protein YfcZ (UPF0381/DUF406 family)
MMYRYGDATPFPLEENFIDTICAATDACVALFQADEIAEARRHKVYTVRKHAEEELKKLELLGRSVEASLRPLRVEGKPQRTSEATALKISQSTQGTIRAAILGVEKRRDAAIRATLGGALGEDIVTALGDFLVGSQLPKSKWTIRWLYDDERGATQTVVKVHVAGCELGADFSCELPPTALWNGAVRVSALARGLTVDVLRKTGVVRKRERSRTESLDKYYVTEAEVSPSRASFVLRQSIRKPSPGFLVVVRQDEQTLPTLTPIDAGGSPQGRALSLSGEGATSLATLWDHIEPALHGLRCHRDTMLEATFRGTDVRRLDDPAELAEAILDMLAPIVRELRLRSRVPGELVLKRDSGDGVREELFVPRAQLDAKFAVLPDQHRRYFEAVGLSSEATCEFVGREFPLAVPRNHQTPPPQPPRRRPRATPPTPPPRKPTMSSLPDLPVPPTVVVERSGPAAVVDQVIADLSSGARKASPAKIRIDTDAVTATA